MNPKIVAQFRQPSGPLGWLVGVAMGVKNAHRSRWVLDLLRPQPGEHVLEVGFGSGAREELSPQRVPTAAVVLHTEAH